MNQQQTSAPYAPPAAPEHASSPYDAPPAWVPTSPMMFAPPKRTFRDRMTAFRDQVVKLWAALAVGAACLVVGLGLGVLIGHEAGGSGTANLQQQPGVGSGQFPGQDGDGQGFDRHGFGGQGLGQDPGTQSDGQSGTTSGGQSGTTTSGTAS
jgi:hypothetical protein